MLNMQLRFLLFTFFLDILAQSLFVKCSDVFWSSLHRLTCSGNGASSVWSPAAKNWDSWTLGGGKSCRKFPNLTKWFSEEAECGLCFSRILASFPCPSCENTMMVGGPFLRPSPNKRPGSIFGWSSCLPHMHDSPRVSGDIFFPEIYVYMRPGSSLFVVVQAPPTMSSRFPETLTLQKWATP